MTVHRDVIPIGEGDIATMCLQLSNQPREYSYFSPRTMATWAGPGYWRFKPLHKSEVVVVHREPCCLPMFGIFP